eukprot:1138148-Pelagomonas_calceolata.AAC.3
MRQVWQEVSGCGKKEKPALLSCPTPWAHPFFQLWPYSWSSPSAAAMGAVNVNRAGQNAVPKREAAAS